MKQIIGIETESLIIYEGIQSIIQENFICKKIRTFEDIQEVNLLIFEKKELSNLKKPKIRMIPTDKIPYSPQISMITMEATEEELYFAIRNTLEGKVYWTKAIQKNVKRIQQQEEEYGELSPREKALLQGILNEYTNLQLAKSLYISEKTVKNNLTQLYRKMDVKNRREIQKKFKKLLTVK